MKIINNVTKKYYLYILIVLSSLTFYNPFGVIPAQQAKFIFYFVCLCSLYYAYKNGVNLHSVKYPRIAYKMLIIGMILSILMVSAFQRQSLFVTIIATLPYILGYLVFYILMKFNIPKEKIQHAIWIFCTISIVTYIVNFISIPNIIFGIDRGNFDDSRGIVRLSIFSLELIVLCFLYSINKWKITKQKKYLLLIIVTGIFIILSVVRQYIIFSLILGILLALKGITFIKKIVLIVTCVCVYYFILPRISVYQKMSEITEEQINSNEDTEDIRIKAWKFYIDEYQTNCITRIFGNGTPSLGKSSWANEFLRTISYDYGGNGCYYVDVGWAGFYWFFGIFATMGLMILLVKGILKSKSEDKLYLSYWCLFIVLISIASGPIIFYHQVISISTVLYLVYGKEDDSNNYIKFQ